MRTAAVDYINGQYRVTRYQDGAVVDRTWFGTDIAANSFADAWRS